MKQKERFRYHNNVDYHDRVRARAKALYQKTADIPKQKRGRKPKAKHENDDEIKISKPIGRPLK